MFLKPFFEYLHNLICTVQFTFVHTICYGLNTIYDQIIVTVNIHQKSLCTLLLVFYYLKTYDSLQMRSKIGNHFMVIYTHIILTIETLYSAIYL